ncbi:alpha/beta-Hydrolases superfamily protein [Rhynchospora pubera]|uniref:Alpha/beta-Hydrolases superfamily protein n=1 Tax=Rhynchospora pubera TaxID=906938 RepID=A0AAV8CB31_9POAL|nr:alpha/beta-Hydrolases superfamily protein [Rhynchospora pubera]
MGILQRIAGVPPPPKPRRIGIRDEKVVPLYPANLRSPLVIFANGSTLSSTSDWVLRWKQMVGDALNAIDVVVFDYPEISAEERKGTKKSTEKMLFDYHWNFLEDTLINYPGHPLILMGTSLGSRINCMIAWYQHFNISLQLYAWEKYGRLCDRPIDQYIKPTIFIQGNEDPFCPFDQFDSCFGVSSICNRLHKVEGITSSTDLLRLIKRLGSRVGPLPTSKGWQRIPTRDKVEGGDEFLQVRKDVLEFYKTTQEEVERKVFKEIAEYVFSMIGEQWINGSMDRLYALGFRSGTAIIGHYMLDAMVCIVGCTEGISKPH